MSDMEFSIADIKELMASVKQNNLGKLKIKSGDVSIEIEGAQKTVAAVQTAVTETTALAVQEAPAMHVSEAAPTAVAISKGNVVTSPIVGTFYESPAPDKPAYVKVGDKVSKGDVLFIIESMKLMNEVTSEYNGTVTAFHIENSQAVEYGQPILTIE